METLVRNIEFQNNQIFLLNKHKKYGFKNENALISYALELFKEKIQENKELEKSADIYAEIYAQDEELQFLTESALNDLSL